jgi:hypothetical protein
MASVFTVFMVFIGTVCIGIGLLLLVHAKSYWHYSRSKTALIPSGLGLGWIVIGGFILLRTVF